MRRPRTYETTRYELVARHADGRTILVGYTNRRDNARNLCDFLTNPLKAGGTRMDLTAAATGTNRAAWQMGKRAADGAYCGRWRVIWTGRTEREVCGAGELAASIYD